MTDQRPWLLVVGAGERPFREYLLASIGERYRVHLLTGKEPDWERPHLAGWTVLSNPLETVDATEMIAAARRLPDLAGVLAWDEAQVLQADIHPVSSKWPTHFFLQPQTVSKELSFGKAMAQLPAPNY